MLNDILQTAPLWSLFLFSLVLLTLKLLNRNREGPVGVVTGLSLMGVVVSFFCVLYIFQNVMEGESLSLFSSALVLSPLRAVVSMILLTATAGTFLMSCLHPQVNPHRFSEVMFLKMNALVGLLVLLWSGNLLTAFIGLELASLTFYLLIALGRTGPLALKAGFKYFVLGSVAAAFLLYGLSFFVGATGHFDLMKVLQESPHLITESRLLALAFVFILVGFLFKVSIFPFQFWLPEVYQGAFTPLLVFMATGFKLVVFALLFEWTLGVFAVEKNLPFLLALFQWLAVLSVLFGNIIPLMEKDFKKILLFSTIAHSGYLLMILMASQAGFEQGKQALFYYLILYVIMTLGIFICLRPFEREGKPEVPLSALTGMAFKKPWHAFFITLFLLSLAGIPPTGGFMAKFFLFQALLDQGFWWMLFWTVTGSSIAFFYYLKPIALMYMQERPEQAQQTVAEDKNLPYFLKPVLWLLALLVFLAFFLPSLFVLT